MEAAQTTEAVPRPTARPAAGRRAGKAADPVTVALLAVAGFLAVLALLSWQLANAPVSRPPRVALVRRVYQTTVVETIPGAKGGSTISQSSSSSSLPPVASTRSSGAVP